MDRQEGSGLRARATVARFDDLIALRDRVWNDHIELKQAR
jgi:hypothetical protein